MSIPLISIHSEEQKDATPRADQENQEDKAVEEEKDGNEDDEPKPQTEDWAIFSADGVEIQLNLKERIDNAGNGEQTQEEDDDDTEKFFIGEFLFCQKTGLCTKHQLI